MAVHPAHIPKKSVRQHVYTIYLLNMNAQIKPGMAVNLKVM